MCPLMLCFQVGFDMLERYKRVAEGMVYWSRHPIDPPQIIYQSQRPFIQHREPDLNDAEAIEGKRDCDSVHAVNVMN